MADLSDRRLTEQGMKIPDGAASPILIIACGALAREILALIKGQSWDHLTLTCLPANLHLYPEKITDAVTEAVQKHRADFDQIFIAYADCGTGGLLEKRCAELGVQMIKGPHCYSFYEGNDRFSTLAEDEITAFYLTDFLVKQFDAFVWKPMGLDRHPELRDMYFGNYTKLVYQAQTDNPDLDQKARDIAAKMNLPLERRYTGYGDLATTLAGISH
ncbi:hypothetical protein GCM10007939_04780 [Amylibacter marinus]|uniref:DUF1638 domain-containing protein n=1 Tax=Amylibacter marinus TaxID=1475483 RepID=A0ABQ5VSC0_9RHOB|nr:DUF1638 domain-containing protein [Amylibacter marinus]GLQ34195.1 hypothetical protein GCM10007939_04780 [Amylibacter marinus]